jgi:hypothetical protein
MKELCLQKDAPSSGLPAQAWTFGPHPSRNSRLKLELSAQARSSSKPNKKGCSGLTFWIPIWTVLNSWETWKIRLGEVSYWDKTTPSIYMRGSWPIKFPSIQSTNTTQNHLSFYHILLSLFPSTSPRSSSVLHGWRIDDDDTLERSGQLG